jgi:hypothetical protein
MLCFANRHLFAICIGLVPLCALAGDSPEQVLARHALKQINGTWHLAAASRITERVQLAERLERRASELRKHIDKMLDHNERMSGQLAVLSAEQKRLRDLREVAKDGSNERKRLDEQIKQHGTAIDQLKKAIVPEDKLGATAPLKGLVMELVGVRSELAFHLLAARRRITELPAQYASLQSNNEVSAALAALEPPGQLAPLRSFASELRSLDRTEKLVFTGELPLFREDKRWRITGIANEELPLTFSLYQRSDVTLITHTMAESLGLEVPKKSRKEQRLADGPRVRVTPVKLASLRFGQHVLRDIEVFVLAPEHENLGARISHSAFRGLRVRVVPERLLLLLEPGESRDAS